MKKLWIFIFLTVLALNPALVSAYADEHEHAGTEHQGMMMHHEDSKGIHEQHAATLREAAAALKDSRPDLAVKLETIAQSFENIGS